jgi:hypothetical protein
MTDYGDRCACGECNECIKQKEKPIFKTYIGVKIIKAIPMDECTFNEKIGKKDVNPNEETREGYLVIYPDGYKSWSPKSVFEQAYRLVSDSEKLIIKEH